MEDTSTTTVSHEVAKQAYDNWEKEYDRCKEAFDIADAAASKVIKVEKTWYRKEKTLKQWIEGKCEAFWFEYDYMLLLHTEGKYNIYGEKEAGALRYNYKGYCQSYNIKCLLSSGNDIQATAWVMKFIDKWGGIE